MKRVTRDTRNEGFILCWYFTGLTVVIYAVISFKARHLFA